MKCKHKWFTLVELIVVMTMLSILWASGYFLLNWNTREKQFRQYQTNVQERTKDLYQKALIGNNWYYSNYWINESSHIKITCNNDLKTLEAYICDEINIIWTNCIPLDFPQLESTKFGVFLNTLNWVNEINECIVMDINSDIFTPSTYNIEISTVFPNGNITAYKPDNVEPNNPLLYIPIAEAKVKLKEDWIVSEFYPILLK